MAERFSLKDHLFNPQSVGQLAQEYGDALPYFDAARFKQEALAGFAERELLARLEWMADCIEAQLPTAFDDMADALEAAMPAPLDPTRNDDDFGQFIHAVPGILAVRHGLEWHRTRAMALLYAATKRFSMEFYVRPFLNRWTDETLSDLELWAGDENYHVRRLVSEGSRPKLPWAKAVRLTPEQTLPLLDKLHADQTRYVTRSVANHLNDLSKITPDRVLAYLNRWRTEGTQQTKELAWMSRHALRTLIKSGDAGAMAALGYRHDAQVNAKLGLSEEAVRVGSDLTFECTITARERTPVILDYRIDFARPNGRPAQKVFKLKQAVLVADTPLKITKKHKLKADATTFKWHRGTHHLTLQVNGKDAGSATFEVT